MRISALLLLLGLGACYNVPGWNPEEPRRPYEHPMTVEQVSKMLEAGVPENVIHAKADQAGVRKLSTDEIILLKEEGASDELLEHLIRRERTPPWS